MSTRGAIGAQRGDTWRGVYNHSDSGPSWLGRELWQYLHTHGADEYRALIENTPQGFSTFAADGSDGGRDGQPYGAYAPKGDPEYQGDMIYEDGCGQRCSPETCDALSNQWVYALSNNGRYLTILGSYAVDGETDKYVAYPRGERTEWRQRRYAHRFVTQVDLLDNEPDWKAIESDHDAWREANEKREAAY